MFQTRGSLLTFIMFGIAIGEHPKNFKGNNSQVLLIRSSGFVYENFQFTKSY